MESTVFEQARDIDYNFRMNNAALNLNRTSSFRDAVDIAVEPKKLKVASYCRVSTEEELQLNSLENQIIHYTNYIRSNPHWKFAGIFTDRGKSGTRTKKRTGFNKIIKSALDGKIDIIICKSISRFARNVIDTLGTVKLLREKGIRVIFEKEELDTGNMQSDFVLTVLSLMAQEESRSISENITWANTKRFEMGKPIFARLLGYTKEDEEAWIIVEEEAEIVREAFNEALKGKKPYQIAKSFIRKGYKKANGRVDWSAIAVRDILKNERYKGDALCQKTYTKNYLSHEIKINEGERNQYLLKDNHEPIVDKETFDKVQDILSKANPKTKIKRGARKSYPLSSRLVCEECGANFQRYICRGKVTWRCGNHMKSNLLCKAEGIPEENVKRALIKAFDKTYKIFTEGAGKHQVLKLIKVLVNAENNKENSQSRLRLELEKALLKENTAIINLEDTTDITLKRKQIEKEIEKSETWWTFFDEDDNYRKRAIETLENIKKSSVLKVELKKNIEDIEFLRAWVTLIKAVSPYVFSITLLNGDEIKIKIEKGDDS
ncbi:recombinase family protein [Senegalia sp. (in: firmicutes)]|uniref:recombinase family protein n=1 Tax=Senegalia sp. (in: firmicutes) TaxID=1924098 RepID=UPI003F9B1FEF